jgi:hypothetical protein
MIRTTMVTDPKLLCLRLDAAFSSMPYPGDDFIVLDNSGSHLECQKIKELLIGRHWRNLPFEILEKLKSAIPFLSPEGYRFYLPAFMVFAAIDFYHADLLADEVVQSLTLPLPEDMANLSRGAGSLPDFIVAQDEKEAILKLMKESEIGDLQEQVFFARISGFSTIQGVAIREFLEYLEYAFGNEFPHHEPAVAVARYWHTFS